MLWAVTVPASATTAKQTFFTEAVDGAAAIDIVALNYPQLRGLQLVVVEAKGASPDRGSASS